MLLFAGQQNPTGWELCVRKTCIVCSTGRVLLPALLQLYMGLDGLWFNRQSTCSSMGVCVCDDRACTVPRGLFSRLLLPHSAGDDPPACCAYCSLSRWHSPGPASSKTCRGDGLGLRQPVSFFFTVSDWVDLTRGDVLIYLCWTGLQP